MRLLLQRGIIVPGLLATLNTTANTLLSDPQSERAAFVFQYRRASERMGT